MVEVITQQLIHDSKANRSKAASACLESSTGGHRTYAVIVARDATVEDFRRVSGVGEKVYYSKKKGVKAEVTQMPDPSQRFPFGPGLFDVTLWSGSLASVEKMPTHR